MHNKGTSYATFETPPNRSGLAVSAALTACGEKTAQTTETPQAASVASTADAAASTAAVSAPQNSANVSDEDKALLELSLIHI